MSDDLYDVRGEQERETAAREKARLAEIGEINDWKWLMSSVRGRRLVWRLLERTGIYRSSMTGNSFTFFREGERNVARERMRQALAVVREHLPVKPSRETVARAIDPGAWRDEPMPERPNSVTDEEWGRIWDRVRTESKAPSLARADAALDLWPGESRAQVEAAALRDAADEYEARLPDGTGNGRAYNSYTVAAMLRARADRLAAEGGADRG